jgi:hypothetical protein
MKLKDLPCAVPLRGLRIKIPRSVADISKYSHTYGYILAYWDQGFVVSDSPKGKACKLYFENLFDMFEIECVDPPSIDSTYQ